MYSSFFFPLLFLFFSTNIILFASQFYGNSFVDFGTCCYTYNSSIVAVAKSSIAAVLFSPISKRFICLFFLLPHKAASHTRDFYRTFFSGIAFSRCLSARFSGIKQRFLPRKFWCRKVHLLHPIILFLHILLYNRLVFSHLFFAASFSSIIVSSPIYLQLLSDFFLRKFLRLYIFLFSPLAYFGLSQCIFGMFLSRIFSSLSPYQGQKLCFLTFLNIKSDFSPSLFYKA